MTREVHPHEAPETYRLFPVLPERGLVLLERKEGGLRLPEVSIPPYTRPAEQITSLVRKTWNLHSVVIDWIAGNDGSSQCAVLEILDPRPMVAPERLRPHPIRDVADDLLPEMEWRIIHDMLCGNCGDRGPFSRFGWMEEAKAWIRECARNQMLHLSEIRQLNASATFALLRFGSGPDGPAYWLKAVGEPNEREFAITSFLVAHCADYLPNVRGTRSDWSAWIMEECGSSLHTSDSPETFQIAAGRLAELQMMMCGRHEELLQIGLRDHRLPVLRAHIDDLMEYLEGAMAQQTSTKVPALSGARLRAIGAALRESCDAMTSLGIPDTLLHGDISPGSILWDGRRCVFTDWCEAYVGNPFITFEQFCIHSARKTSEPEVWRALLIDAYVKSWRNVISDRQIRGALELAPLLSLLSCLYGRGDWLQTARGREPGFQGYTRSLARHMDRLVRNTVSTEVVCRPA